MTEHDDTPIMTQAIIDCTQLVRDARPATFDDARRQVRSRLAERGMVTSASDDNIVDVIARAAMKRSFWSYSAPKFGRLLLRTFRRVGVLHEPIWSDPPKFAQRFDGESDREIIIYARTQLGLLRPAFGRVFAEVAPEIKPELALAEDYPQRSCAVWLAVDPLSSAERISVNIGTYVVGDILESDIKSLRELGASQLPIFGKSYVVNGILIGHDVDSARLALQFPIPVQ